MKKKKAEPSEEQLELQQLHREYDKHEWQVVARVGHFSHLNADEVYYCACGLYATHEDSWSAEHAPTQPSVIGTGFNVGYLSSVYRSLPKEHRRGFIMQLKKKRFSMRDLHTIMHAK